MLNLYCFFDWIGILTYLSRMYVHCSLSNLLQNAGPSLWVRDKKFMRARSYRCQCNRCEKLMQYNLIFCLSILLKLFLHVIFNILHFHLTMKHIVNKSPWEPKPVNIPLWDTYVIVESKWIPLPAVLLSSVSEVAHSLLITAWLSKVTEQKFFFFFFLFPLPYVSYQEVA